MVAPEAAVLALTRTIVEPTEASKAAPDPPALAPRSALIMAVGGVACGVVGLDEPVDPVAELPAPPPDPPPPPQAASSPKQHKAAATVSDDFTGPLPWTLAGDSNECAVISC